MIPCTRRRALHGAAGVLAALAGCSGSSSGSGRSNDPETAGNVETDPDRYVLRNPRDEPTAWLRPEDDRGRERGSKPDATPRRRHEEHGLIADRGTAERLAFADVDGTDGARAFVEGTDFDRETLLLDPERIGECFELDLCYITWSATEYHTYYARLYRDVDVSCRADAHDRVTRLIRIPDTIDPELVRGSGTGIASGGCRSWQRRLEHRRAEANATRRDDASTEAASGGQ